MAYANSASAPLWLWSVSVKAAVSPQARKRGASGFMTSLGATLTLAEAEPLAVAVQATAVTRTSPANSGRSNVQTPSSPTTPVKAAARLRGLKRREATGLTRPMSPPSPEPSSPPILASSALSASSVMGMSIPKRS